MRYLLICFENEQYWLEITEKMIAKRQVIVDENLEIHISCREDCLAEGKIITDELEGICEEISKEEFERQWILAKKPYYDEWLSVKQKYPIGTNVEGVCKYFYPQGTIVEGRDYFAIYIGKKELPLNSTLVADVKEYDEDNLWLVLE